MMTVNVAKSIPGRRARFSTAFLRPSGFRFQVDIGSPQGRFVVWKEGDAEKLWIFRPGATETPLRDGLSRLAFMSGGTSTAVPSLLLSNVFVGNSFLDLFEEPKLTDSEKIDGRKAFIIEGTMQGQVAKLWIDQDSFLILKTFRRVRGTTIDEEVTATYKPAVNIELTADKLIYKPPPDPPAPPRPTASTIDPPAPPNAAAPRLTRFGQSLAMNAADIAKLRKKRRGSTEEDVIRVDTDLVVSEVVVLDDKGLPISGLVAKDFVVKEDGKVQEISSFSIGEKSVVPRSLVLILDYSASELPYIKTSVDAAKMLVDKLKPTDRMALVTDDVKLLVDFTTDKEVLKKNLDWLRARALAGKIGRSAQYDALMATLTELFSEEDLRPIVIFQTDGDQLGLLKGQTSQGPDPYMVPTRYTIEDLKTAAEKARATIYSIIPGFKFLGMSEEDQMKRAELYWEGSQQSFAELAGRSSSNARKPSPESFKNSAARWSRRQFVLTDVANSSGGWADYLEQPEQANEVYARVLSDINRRYVIGYYPTNRTKDGKRRQVTIEVRDHPEYVVSGRKAYFAPQPE